MAAPSDFVQQVVDWAVWELMNKCFGEPCIRRFQSRFPDQPLSLFSRVFPLAKEALATAQRAQELQAGQRLREAFAGPQVPTSTVEVRGVAYIMNQAGEIETRRVVIQARWNDSIDDVRARLMAAAVEVAGGYGWVVQDVEIGWGLRY